MEAVFLFDLHFNLSAFHAHKRRTLDILRSVFSLIAVEICSYKSEVTESIQSLEHRGGFSTEVLLPSHLPSLSNFSAEFVFSRVFRLHEGLPPCSSNKILGGAIAGGPTTERAEFHVGGEGSRGGGLSTVQKCPVRSSHKKEFLSDVKSLVFLVHDGGNSDLVAETLDAL